MLLKAFSSAEPEIISSSVSQLFETAFASLWLMMYCSEAMKSSLSWPDEATTAIFAPGAML